MTTEAAAIASIAQQAIEPTELDPGLIYAIANGDGGLKVIDTDAYRTEPRRVIRKVTAADAVSFLAYLNGRQVDDGDGLEVWADIDSRTMTAIIDGHEGWCADTAVLQLRHSSEWKAWSDRSGRLVSQLEFADFVEDQLSTIAEPEGSVLLEIVQSMQGSTKVQWQSADWLANGARAFQWVEEVEAKAGRKGKLEIPAQFTLGLRPFVGSDPFRVVANLRYRIEHGQLKIGFKLPELDRIIESAFADVVAAVDEGVTVPIIYGKP